MIRSAPFLSAEISYHILQAFAGPDTCLFYRDWSSGFDAFRLCVTQFHPIEGILRGKER